MSRTNNFDGLRLFGALAVIAGHTYPLLGRGDDVPELLGYPLQTVGVIVFFSISGYLITASWTRNSGLRTYLAARCLRIFPALAVAVVLSIVVLGPIATALSVPDYLGSPRTYTYLSNALLLPQHDLPGVFSDLPYPDVVNGSLWTLPVEFACYLAVPVLCLARFGRFRLVALTAFLVGALLLANAATLLPSSAPSVVVDPRVAEAATMWTCFAAGAIIRVVSVDRPSFVRPVPALALLVGYGVVTGLLPDAVSWISWAALPYAVLTLGLASTPYLRRAARYGDFSYGLYLYAFPVQQLVVLYVGVIAVPLNMLLVTAITLVLAIGSWHAVEHPALRLKDRVTRRSAAIERAAASRVAADAQ